MYYKRAKQVLIFLVQHTKYFLLVIKVLNSCLIENRFSYLDYGVGIQLSGLGSGS